MSLLDSLSTDTDSIVTDFYLSRNHPSFNKKTLYLEGKSDIRLFRNIVNEDKIEIIPVQGKKNIISVMKILYRDNIGEVSAICDADFDHLDGKESERLSYGVYITDFHDIELMMLLSPALDKTINNIAKDNLVENASELIKEIIRLGKVVGLLRYISKTKNLGLKFKQIVLLNHITYSNNVLDVNIDSLVDELVSKARTQNITSEGLKDLYYDYESRGYEDNQICCGHDCTKILAKYLNESNNFGGKSFNIKQIEGFLALAFNDYDKYKVFSCNALKYA